MGAHVRLFPRWFVPSFVAVVTLGLAALPASAAAAGGAASPCAYADALAHDGERQAAHAAYLKVLATDPSSTCANKGVVATLAPSTSTFWTTSGNVIMDAGHAAGVVLLGVLVIVVAFLLWLQLQTRARWLRELWPARRIRRPVFSVEPLTDTETDKLGAAVAGLIRGRITWRTDRFGLNLVSGQAGIATAFSGLAEGSNEAKAAVAVITFLTALLPRRRFQLSGQLQPAGDEGVGISLELSQNGNAEALQSVWAASFHLTGVTNPTAYQQLAVASAALVDIWMTKALDDGGLLTLDPQSWAFFRGGMEAQRLGDRTRAKVLYEQALAADGTNVGAMANLGIISRREAQYEDAEEYLKRALDAIEKPDKAPDLPPDENPDWYRIKYQFAALYTNWAADTDPGSDRDEFSARAATVAQELATKTAEVMTRLEAGRRRQQGSAPKAYLRDTLLPFLEGTIEPSVLTLLAGTVSPLPPPSEDWLAARPAREDVHASLARKKVDPWQLIAYVELGTNRPAATQFNLACFYTRAGDLTAAAKRLLRAVRETQRQERGSLVAVATTDPVLRPLMQMRPGIKAKLHLMLDTDEQFNGLDDLLRHFERQDRTMSHYNAQGFMVSWGLDMCGADLTASKKSERLLIRLLGRDANGDTLDAVYGMVAWFRDRNPDLDVKAAVVVPGDDYPLPDLTEARDRGIEVLKDTGHSLECLSAGAPLVGAGVS